MESELMSLVQQWSNIFPQLTEEEVDLIEDVCMWNGEERDAFLIARRDFESQSPLRIQESVIAWLKK